MANKKYRVLHVDDEPDTLEVVRTILEKEGFEVISADTGKEALAKITENNFDLLLLDVMMKDMSGWDLFSRIAKIEPDYKVVFLTVLEITDERLAELKKHGIKGYIAKPFDKDELVEKVKKFIKE